jgi:hypothetical protein
MNQIRRRLMAVTGDLTAALVVGAASVAISIWVSDRTNSGLFGICGPYGSSYSERRSQALPSV